jgi:hypothetical protein
LEASGQVGLELERTGLRELAEGMDSRRLLVEFTGIDIVIAISIRGVRIKVDFSSLGRHLLNAVLALSTGECDIDDPFEQGVELLLEGDRQIVEEGEGGLF